MTSFTFVWLEHGCQHHHDVQPCVVLGIPWTEESTFAMLQNPLCLVDERRESHYSDVQPLPQVGAGSLQAHQIY